MKNRQSKTRNEPANDIISFLDLSKHKEALDSRIGELEDTLEMLEKQIDFAEHEGNGQFAEFLAEEYNALNKVRLNLQVKSNQLERTMLQFELDQLDKE